jgi:hypothetical protein
VAPGTSVPESSIGFAGDGSKARELGIKKRHHIVSRGYQRFFGEDDRVQVLIKRSMSIRSSEPLTAASLTTSTV